MISKVYNLKQTGRPAYISAAKTGKHSESVKVTIPRNTVKVQIAIQVVFCPSHL